MGSSPTLSALGKGGILKLVKRSIFNLIDKGGYTVEVAGQTVNLLPFGSGSSTLSPCTSLRGFKFGSRTDCLGCRSKRMCENHVAPPYLYLVVVMVTAS